MAITKNKADISRGEQIILNRTVDDKFEVVAVELLGYDATNDVLRRIAVTSDGKLKVSL